LIAGIAKEIRKYLCHREEVDLKRDLLANGMSAADIERVVRAKSASRAADFDPSSDSMR
jgi:hypothetical protein